MQDNSEPHLNVAVAPATSPSATAKVLPPAAQRALAEAAERQADLARKAAELARQPEIHGRGGLDPVRYDDWEHKGITSDF